MFKRIPIFIISILLLYGTAATAYEGEEIIDVTYIPITENGFVADTLDGVEAYYNASDRYYQCSDLVTRYYKEVFGVEMNYSSGPVSETEGYFFEIAEDEPKRGDIAYSTAAARGKGYGHWAIVKDYSDGAVTFIEQNWRYGSEAGIERRIIWPSSVYTFYTLTDGETDTFPSLWAKDRVSEALGAGIYDVNDIECYRECVESSEFTAMLGNVAGMTGMRVAIPNSVLIGDVLTRGEAALMVYKMLDSMGIDLTVNIDTDVFIDYIDTEDEAEAMAALIERRIMHAYDGIELRPDGEVSVELAMIIALAAYEYYDRIMSASPSYISSELIPTLYSSSLETKIAQWGFREDFAGVLII